MQDELYMASYVMNTTTALMKEGTVARKVAASAGVVIDTARAIMGFTAGYSELPIVGQALAIAASIMTAAMGAYNLAQINNVKLFEQGGYIDGNSHKNGGVPFSIAGRGGFEAEGGEYMVNKEAVRYWGIDRMEAINQKRYYATGGYVPHPSAVPQAEAMTSDMLEEIVSELNDKKVINDPIEAAYAQDEAQLIENRGDI